MGQSTIVRASSLAALALWAAGSAAQDRPASPEPADHAAQMPASAAAPTRSPVPVPSPAANSEASADHVGHTDDAAPKSARLLPGYGNGGFTITTAVPQAQAFFSNGLELGSAFAAQGGAGAMTESVRLELPPARCANGARPCHRADDQFRCHCRRAQAAANAGKDAASLAAKTYAAANRLDPSVL